METKHLFNERRSVNYFNKNKSLSEEQLKDIVNMAVLAPSAFNLQPWRIIAVKTDAGKQRLFGLANKQEKVGSIENLGGVKSKTDIFAIKYRFNGSHQRTNAQYTGTNPTQRDSGIFYGY